MKAKVVTICGSMRFAKDMIKIASDLEKEHGWCVLQCVYDINPDSMTKEEMENITKAHWTRIDICDAIYVVNIGGYLGNSTKNEITYAQTNGKEVIYHEN